MARPKSNKSSHKATEDSVTVATDSPPSPPTTRNKTYAAVVEADQPKKTRRHRRSKSKSEHSHDDDSVESDDNNKLATAVNEKTEKARVKASKASSATKKELDRSLRKAKKVVGDLSSSFEETRTWPLPGVLSDIVEGDIGELGRMAVWSLVSLIVSTTTRVALDSMSTGWSQTWVSWPSYFGTADLPSTGSVAAMFVSRMIRMTLSNGYLAIPNLAAINILYYGPIVYLLSSYYNVPLSATLFSEGINFVSEFVPLFLHHYVLHHRRSAEVVDGDEIEDDEEILLYDKSVTFDPVSYAYSALFASVLYGFTFVQACRFFLPTTLVVHFFGIATVEPARAHPLSRSAPLTLYEVFSAVFQSVPAVLLNLACGIAARTFIFNHHYGLTEVSPGFSRSAALYRRIITVRTAALSLSVGLSIFLHCFFNIKGVDAVGASAFASIWTVAPLLVGIGLGFAGV
ncbi:hypothetical protein SBRCBS47491_003589 [Sporothrix bragantina]|uniref:Uncharacterized protein n=1 Tax=Sporothrix bragantina TaxID=671064 RepID=A0ABP0BHR8_9PEZI